MDKQRAQLVVSISNVQFAREFNYFLTVQTDGDGEKKRTDISESSATPQFTANVFVLPLMNFKIEINQKLLFGAYIVADKEQHETQELLTKGQAKLLGESVLELGPLTAPLTDISRTGVRQHLKFTRRANNEEKTVGRFIVQLKLIGTDEIPIQEFRSLDSENIFHPVGQIDPIMDFLWRIRVDVRSGVDLPLNRQTPQGLPSCFVELGWTMYDQQIPDEAQMFLTDIVENNRNPLWNQQFVIPNPPTIHKKDLNCLEGFLYICLRDKYLTENIDTIYIPLTPLYSFYPYNFEFLSSKQEYETRGKMHISVCLEMKDVEIQSEEITDIVVHNINNDPLPLANRCFLIMTLNGYKPEKLNFIQVDLKSGVNLAKYIEDNTLDNLCVYISPILALPTVKAQNYYHSVCTFTLPKSYLNAQIQFQIVGRDDNIGCYHMMPNAVVGHTDAVDQILTALYYFSLRQNEKQSVSVPVTWDQKSTLFPRFSNSKCSIELNVFSIQKLKQQQGITSQKNEKSKGQSQINFTSEMKELVNIIQFYYKYKKSTISKGQQQITIPQNISQGDKEKWQILQNELSQKQEIIHRMMKEIDDKSESLKITGAEIVDLRRHVKMLQSENAILRKRLAHEEQIEISALVTQEISKMSTEELKAKIIKVAQAYRDERIRNEEFEKSLKSAQYDIAQARQLQQELEVFQRKHQEDEKKLQKMTQEMQKIQLYKETIQKQEKVITKLEQLMEGSLTDTQKAREALSSIETLKLENINLRNQLKKFAYEDGEYTELDRLRNENVRLERLILELQEELKSKRPVTSYGNDLEMENVELKVRLEKCQTRCESLQYEMTENAKNFAKEIANKKMEIYEKQALLDTLKGDY